MPPCSVVRRLLLSTAFTLCCFLARTNCIKVEEFYPFGSEAGDAILSNTDDGSSLEIPLQGFFPFYDENQRKVFVSFDALHGAFVHYNNMCVIKFWLHVLHPQVYQSTNACSCCTAVSERELGGENSMSVIRPIA